MSPRLSSRHIISLAVMAIFGLIFPCEVRAQSDPLFVQHWALPTLYNPAATGDTDFIRIRGGARLQWIGIDNAPRSFVAAADSPFKIMEKRIGAGATFTQESLGLFSNLLVNAQVSYKIPWKKGRFGVGLQIGYFNSKFKGSDVFIPDGDDYHEPDDPAIPKRDISGNAVDFSVGANYVHPLFSLGISALHLTSPTLTMKEEGNENTETVEYETQLRRSFYFTASGNIAIKNSLFQVHPSLICATDLSGFSADLSLRASYNRFISFGAGYSWKEAVSVMVAGEYKNFFLGYSYSYPLTAIAKASSGSHEIVAGYSLKLDMSGKNKNKQRSIRLM